MKKIVKLLLLTLICSLLLSMTAAAAASTVATIGKKKYTSLEKAIAKVKKGQTIKLKKNVTINKPLEMKRNVKYTIDLNKKTLTCNGSEEGDIFINKGTVTLTNGTVKGSIIVNEGVKLTIKSGNYRQFVNYGTLEVKNAKITNKNDSAILNMQGKTIIKKATVKSNTGCLCILGGAVSISGGTFKNYNKKNELPIIILEKGTLTTTGGKFTSNDCVLFNYGGKATLKNGTFSMPGTCTIINYKNTVISGATVEATGKTYESIALFGAKGSSTKIKKGLVVAQVFTVMLENGFSKFELSGGKVQNMGGIFPPIYVNELKSEKISIKDRCVVTMCDEKVYYTAAE